MKLRLMISTLCVASIAMAGCASKVTQPDEYSGFLSDYSQLKEAKSPSGVEVMRWVDPQLDLSRYTAVYIEPTQFYPKPQATTKIPESTLNGINTYFNQALKRELGKSLPLANGPGPGPGVMVVRAAITAVSSKTEGLKPYEFVPVALVAAAVSTGTGIRDQETTLGTEAQFLDGANGKVLAQVVRKGTGKPLSNDSQVMKADDVKGVIDDWASDLHQSYVKLKKH